MTMPYPGEPFAEAVGEAVQTSTAAVRLVLAVADAVRRAAQRRSGREHPLPPTDQALPEAASDLKTLLAPDVAWLLMSGPDWPVMAQQLVALRRAGVDLERFLPQVGDIAVSVRDAVLSDSARIAAERTQEWAGLLRATVPAGPVREAILASPLWPEIAATMQELQERGVDVRRVLAAAYAEGVGVDEAVDRVPDAVRRRSSAPSRDAVRSYGPLTVGLDLPRELDLGNRRRALAQLGVSQSENARFVRWVYEAMPGLEREAALLVNSRQWPLLAARMARMQDDGKPVRDHLARLMRDRGWESGPVSYLGPRLVQAATEALRRPAHDEFTSAAVVTDAARASSASAGPPPSWTRGPAPTGPRPAAHRAPIPKPSTGRSR
ncbi:hypothetical protein [Kitasatospora sp. SUK 42]|uniref:hypothetical protein n=1 Tax=Kitasatospora sp. SUK 42 TaxID=1588882 RepID=UPI0018CB2CD9|nr:hypothetical protein [Kitasatospora sp. SUK 42]MBV2155091.1 hypothetical protein [Kitasatospora sp. SUK 42]